MLVCAVGWSHTKFGKLAGEDIESLMLAAGSAAVRDAGLTFGDIDQVVVGTFNGGLSRQDFPSSLVLHADPVLRFKPATRVENACATGSAAVHQGAQAVKAGAARFVLVIGAEKMTDLSSHAVGKILLRASYVKETGTSGAGFAGVFGAIAEHYFQKYGDQSDALARIAAKNHRNAMSNPLAHFQRDLSFDFCRTESPDNPRVAGPLKRTDCAAISDGAAAVVLTDAETALRMDKAVALRGMAQAADYLSLKRRDDLVFFEGAAAAWSHAQERSGVGNADLDFIELHDCFTISELIQYEALGLAPRGCGAEAILNGSTEMGGRLPVNPSGGLKARGHPLGATGVSMLVNAAKQLTNAAGDMQIKDAALGGIFNMGGVAVANYATIVERLR